MMPMPGYRKLVEAAMPGSVPDLRAKLPIHQRSIERIINKIRAEGATDNPNVNTLCRVIGWKRSPNGGSKQPIYAMEAGRDAPCLLKTLTPKQVRDRYVARIKGTEKEEEIKARERTRVQVARRIRVGDPLLNAFFGRGAA